MSSDENISHVRKIRPAPSLSSASTVDRQITKISKKKIVRDSKSPKPLLKEKVKPSDCLNNDAYYRAWSMLKDHTINLNYTHAAKMSKFAGTADDILRLMTIPMEKNAKGRNAIYVTRQECKTASHASGDGIKNYRCFVIEHDDGRTCDEQLKQIIESGLPTSFQVWSGSKSLHVWVCLNSPISRDEMIDASAKLAHIFKSADMSVLKHLNKYARFPIDLAPYHQPLVGTVRGHVKNEEFFAWLETNFESERQKHLTVSTDAIVPNKKAEEIVKTHGSDSRSDCPVCEKRGRFIKNSLSIRRCEGGRLLVWCFRCALDKKDQAILRHHYLHRDHRGPNMLVDHLVERVSERFLFNNNTRMFNHFRGRILLPVEESLVNRELWDDYEQEARDLDQKISEREFRDIIHTLNRKTTVMPLVLSKGKIVLNDESVVDLSTGKVLGRVKAHVDFHLPLSREQWEKPATTPLWDRTLKQHTTKEDGDILEALLGYIFSGVAVKEQECCLLIHGPRDTGKSTLLELVSGILGPHSTKASISDCLSSPLIALNIVGKRLAVSTEASIRTKDIQRFRSLISGEQVKVKRFYVGEYQYPHNCVFLTATNDEAWIEDSPENRKRIRVVKWINEIKHPDFSFAAKLKTEAPGVIVKCLKAYTPYLGKRIPENDSTRKYMEQANRNINAVAQWIDERGIGVGDHFISTKKLQLKYMGDTGDTIKQSIFSRLIAKALPKESATRYGSDQQRGYLIDKKRW